MAQIRGKIPLREAARRQRRAGGARADKRPSGSAWQKFRLIVAATCNLQLTVISGRSESPRERVPHALNWPENDQFGPGGQMPFPAWMHVGEAAMRSSFEAVILGGFIEFSVHGRCLKNLACAF
jgi:hypothetical protein